MSRARWIAALVLACTPHEHPQEPIAPCPADMALVDGHRRFCIDVSEVSTAAYGACERAGQCTPALVGADARCNLLHADRGDHPINCVSLHQAAAFCGWLGKRVPTDDEWLFVARAGMKNTKYPWGDQAPDPTRACLDSAGTCELGARLAGAGPEGLVDLVGNVAEWVQADERWQLRGFGFDRARDRPLDLFANVPFHPPDHAAVTSGIRCAVAPETPVQVADTAGFTPYVRQPVELPTLAAEPVLAAPTRPSSNFAILHHTPASNDPPRRWWPLGARFVAAEPADPAGLALTDPLDLGALPDALDDFHPLRDLGAFVLMATDRRVPHFLAYERATGKIRWQLDLDTHGASYFHVIAPQTLVAQLYGAKEDTLSAFSLDSGREVWRLPGGAGAPFSRVSEAWSDGERAYALGDRGLFAFDPATGAVLWSGVAVETGCGVTSDDGTLIVEDPAGHRLIAPATGALERRLPAPKQPKPTKKPRRADDDDELHEPACRWNLGEWDGGLPAAVVEGGRMFAFDRPGPRGAATLRAVDLATGAERWRRSDLGTGHLDADHDIVLAERTGEILVVLDAGTGETRAEFSFAGPFEVDIVPGGGAAGPLLVVDSWEAGTWILGRAAEPPVPEVYSVRGRLVPRYLPRKRAAGVPVRAGERIARSDERGRFEVRGRALGAVSVALGSDRGPDVRGGLHVRFESLPVILDGRRTYDVGDIPLYEWYME